MKVFKSKNKKSINELTLILIAIATILFLIFYKNRMNKEIKDIAVSKLEEQTNLIIKRNIVPSNVSINELVNITKNNKGEIIYSDINMDYANSIMLKIIDRVQDEIFNLDYKNDSLMKKYNNNYYMELPLLFSFNSSFISMLGPKVPVKIDFFEHGFGNIDLDISEYGINNVVIKVYLTIDIEQKLYFPYKEEKYNRQYKILIASKIINGIVPNIYGGNMNKSISLK